MTLSGCEVPQRVRWSTISLWCRIASAAAGRPISSLPAVRATCRLLLELSQKIAAHESPRTTKLYDRTSNQYPLDERTYRHLKRYITIASAICPEPIADAFMRIL